MGLDRAVLDASLDIMSKFREIPKQRILMMRHDAERLREYLGKQQPHGDPQAVRPFTSFVSAWGVTIEVFDREDDLKRRAVELAAQRIEALIFERTESDG
jgi:hypothetical protein